MALLVALGVVLVHAMCDHTADHSDSHNGQAFVDQDHHDRPVASAAMPRQDHEPSTPAAPCHIVRAASTLSALPSSTPRELLARVALAVTVAIATQAPLLQRMLLAEQSSRQRHPPDLFVLCVLRV